MLVVETIAKIRRAVFREGKPIKAICRDLGVSRKVVRKVVRSGATEFRYEREVQPLPKIGRWRDELDRLLTANEGKPPRERLTLIRLFEELRGRGYEGGYDAVRRYAGRWAKDRGQATAAAYVPLSFAERNFGDCRGESADFMHQAYLAEANSVVLIRGLHWQTSSQSVEVRQLFRNQPRCAAITTLVLLEFAKFGTYPALETPGKFAANEIKKWSG